MDELIESETREFITLPKVSMTRTCLLIPEDTTFEEWKNIGHQLRNVDGAIQFWIGDWINFGYGHFPERYFRAAQETGYSTDAVRAQSWVAYKCQSVSRETDALIPRRENLSWSHHKAVAALPSATANRLLDDAEKDKLTIKELNNAIHEWHEEHKAPDNVKKETVFSWYHEEHVVAMLEGMKSIKAGVVTLIHDQRDPNNAKYLLEMVRKLMVEITGTINDVLGDENERTSENQ